MLQTTEPTIAREHVRNNEEVRKLLGNRGIVPEQLPPAEDIKKIERRVEAEQKKLLNVDNAILACENAV